MRQHGTDSRKEKKKRSTEFLIEIPERNPFCDCILRHLSYVGTVLLGVPILLLEMTFEKPLLTL